MHRCRVFELNPERSAWQMGNELTIISCSAVLSTYHGVQTWSLLCAAWEHGKGMLVVGRVIEYCVSKGSDSGPTDYSLPDAAQASQKLCEQRLSHRAMTHDHAGSFIDGMSRTTACIDIADGLLWFERSSTSCENSDLEQRINKILLASESESFRNANPFYVLG